MKGHPLRIRYDVPLVAAAAAITGVGIGLLPRRVRAAAGIAVVALAVWQARPFDTGAGVVKESQRDAAQRGGTARGHGLPGVALGSPTHHDEHGIPRALHARPVRVRVRDSRLSARRERGNLEVRGAHPYPFVEWIAVEEQAEGGDEIYHQGKLDPRFFEGYDRVAEGGGVALYRRAPFASSPAETNVRSGTRK